MDLFEKYANEFTEEDRERCGDTVNKVLYLADLARKEGLLALESAIDENDNFFLKLAVNLIVDGTYPELVEKVLNNFILSGNYNSYEKLSACIITNGVLDIQAGENPMVIHLKIASMLGERHCSEYINNAVLKTNQKERYQSALSKLEADKTETLKESEQFEALFLEMSDKSIQRILRNITNEDCVLAFSGCSFRGLRKVLNNLSLRLAEMILEDINRCSASRQDILNAQERILEQVKELEKSFEIYIAGEGLK